MPARANHIGQQWPKVLELQDKLHQAAKLSRTRRFHALYDKLWRSDVLERAWAEVASNGGAPGVDGVSIEAVKQAGVDVFLAELAAKLKAGSYRPQPVRRVRIPKPDGSQRELGVPTVTDRCVQAAAKLMLEPVFEADFSESSYGFRPGRGAHDALTAISNAVREGRRWVLDADIRTFFDSIDRDRLMAAVRERVCDRRMLRLIRLWLDSKVIDGTAIFDTETGTPQGGVISPLLANIALTALDREFNKMGRGVCHVRYADDFVVVVPTEQQAQEVQRRAAAVLSGWGLSLHPDKTRIVGLDRGEGFDFLGFHHRKVSAARTKRRYLRIEPSAKVLKRARARVRKETSRRMLTVGLDDTVKVLNLFLRGWGGYFRFGHPTKKFATLDWYVHRRLAYFQARQRRHHRWMFTAYPFAWSQLIGIVRLRDTYGYQQRMPPDKRRR